MHNFNIVLSGEKTFTEEEKYMLMKENIIDGMLCIRTEEGIINIKVEDVTVICKKKRVELQNSPQFVSLTEFA